ncbi:MAG: cysteine desulfurase [Bacteroidales bacterium]
MEQKKSHLDVASIRKDFPILEQEIYGKPLAYFDNAATTHKPNQVIDAVAHMYRYENSNIHRGVHYLSEQLTQRYESARASVQKFIGAAEKEEVIFTKGTTESINLVAFSFGEKFVQAGDEILITAMEHHANIVPWQMLCQRKGAILKVLPVDDNGDLQLDKLEEYLSDTTRLVAVAHISNALGTVNDVNFIIDKAHAKSIPVLIDGAQSVQHTVVDVQAMDCDFFVFSGHKLYGPTGIGVLYAKRKWLEQMPPYQTGGEMIQKVSFEETTFNDIPFRFEAGTPNMAGAIGLERAITYVQDTGLEAIAAYEEELLQYATNKMKAMKGIRIIGTARKKVSVLSFVFTDIHHLDAGMILDKMGVAVRTGHHCAEPIMHLMGVDGTIRASFSFYNTFQEIDRLFEGLEKVQQMFG